MTRILINHVRRATCAVYGVTGAELDAPDRIRRLVYARQMAMAICKELTGQSHVKIGNVFNRDDVTVIYSKKAVDERVRTRQQDFDTYHEIVRLARAYAEGRLEETPIFSRSADLDVVPDAQIREMRSLKIPEWTIAQRCGVPVTEVVRVLEKV